MVGLAAGIGLIVTFAMYFNQAATQSPISSSQEAVAQVPVPGQAFVSLIIQASDPGAAEAWMKTHPEDFSNQVILDDSMLAQSPVLLKAVQGAAEGKYGYPAPRVYTVEPLSASDLNSIISVLGASKLVQVYSSTGDNFNEKGEVVGKVAIEESHALVKYGNDYLTVAIHKTTTM